MQPPRTHTALAALLSLCSWAGTAFAQTDYEAAMSEAARLEAAGTPREAAAAIDRLSADFPDDYALALRLGWLWFSANEYRTAQRHYTHALTLSHDTSVDARLGLAWCLLRLADPAAARAAFERVLAAAPLNLSAREGLGLARAAEPRVFRVWPSLWLGAQFYSGHPNRTGSYSATAAATMQLLESAVLDLTWRAVDYGYASSTTGHPRAIGHYLQQEFYASAGISRPHYALRLHLGYLWDASNSLVPATVFGASGRVSLHGPLQLEASAAVFTDHTVVRAAGSWAATLTPRWSLGPVASVQYGDGTVGGSVGALVAWHHRGYSLSLSGRYGSETRTVSLADALTFATTDTTRGALSLAARLPLSQSLAIAVGYDFLRMTPSTGSSDADAHFITLGLVAR